MLMTRRLFSTSRRHSKLDQISCVLATTSMEVDGEGFLVFLSWHYLERSAYTYVPDVVEPIRSQFKVGISRDLTLYHLNRQYLMEVACLCFNCSPAVEIFWVFFSPVEGMTLNIEDLGAFHSHCLCIFPRAFRIIVTDEDSLILRYSRLSNIPCMLNIVNNA